MKTEFFRKPETYNFKNPDLTKYDWIVQDAVISPYLSWFAEISFTKALERYGFGAKIIVVTTHNELGQWRFDRQRMVTLTQEVLDKKEGGREIVDHLYREWLKFRTVFFEAYDKFIQNDHNNIAKISNKELWEQFSNFSETYIYEYAPALFTEFPSAYGDKLLKEIAEKTPELVNAAAILTSPEVLTFAQQEESELLKLADISPDDKEALPKHQQKYFWMHNNYRDTDRIPLDFFQQRLDEAIKKGDATEQLKQNQQKFEQLQKKKKELRSQFDDSILRGLELISFCAGWQDGRKQCNLMANYVLAEYLKEFSRRLNIDLNLLGYASPWEIGQILFNKLDLKSVLVDRRKGYVRITTDTEELNVNFADYDRFLKLLNTHVQENLEVDEIQGVTASLGRAVGRVRVVLDAKQVRYLEPDTVLVAGMTRPEYLPLMKQAVAIVTNEGGMTSHAAIVSREFGIPCIIGTKIATKVLKDGDLVEVDANKGTVRRIADAK